MATAASSETASSETALSVYISRWTAALPSLVSKFNASWEVPTDIPRLLPHELYKLFVLQGRLIN
jgi:hypothetical protein